MESAGDWEKKLVMNELMQAHELTKQLRNHLSPSSPGELLTQKILSSFNKALSMLKSSGSEGEPQLTGPASGTDSPHSVSESPRSENSNRAFLDPECRDGSKKRKMQPKWSEQVRVSSGPSLEGPPDDGNSWRKYGQKDILGAKYPRAYYRCTHRNVQGCAAKKQVQRSEEDPSIFQVMYQGHHTCMQATSVIRGASPASPELKEQQQQQPQQGVLLNFKTGLKVRTEDLDTQGVNSSSFSFPHASIQGANVGECIFSSSSLDSPFMSTFSPPFMSPATSGSNYFSSVSPCHMNSYGGGGSTSMPTAGTSDINEIISAVTSGSNSSLVDLEFSLDQFDASTFLS
nr:WRKY26 [Phoebe bournei]